MSDQLRGTHHEFGFRVLCSLWEKGHLREEQELKLFTEIQEKGLMYSPYWQETLFADNPNWARRYAQLLPTICKFEDQLKPIVDLSDEELDTMIKEKNQ